eukprot:7993253-Karenia_brevis.AAC.1
MGPTPERVNPQPRWADVDKDINMGWQSVPVEMADSSVDGEAFRGDAREREYEPDDNRSETSEVKSEDQDRDAVDVGQAVVT